MQKKQKSDEDKLLDEAIRGNEEAFSTLYSAYKGKIYYLCFGILKDQEIAEDVTQEAFVHAYNHLKDFRREAKFYTWLYKIAKNLSLNALIKRNKQKKREKRIIDPLFQKIQKRAQKSLQDKEGEELLTLIQKKCETLPPHQRVVFEMFVLEGKKHKEIAALLHIPQGTVRSRLFYARKAIIVD